LKRQFPNLGEMRHAIAHEAELRATPADVAKNFKAVGEVDLHGLKIPVAAKFDESGIFSTSHKGDIVQYELSDTSLAALTTCRREVYAAFRGAVSAL